MPRLLLRPLAAILLTALATSAQGKLGESQDETILRFGARVRLSPDVAPLLTNAPEHQYLYKGWIIRVAFVEGLAASQSFQKQERPGISLAITPDELKAIFEPEGGLSSWIEIKPPEGSPAPSALLWQRADGAKARLDLATAVLTIDSAAAVQHEKKVREDKEAKIREAVPKF